jgi:hypothetical protein
LGIARLSRGVRRLLDPGQAYRSALSWLGVFGEEYLVHILKEG